jgi:hypothetical protein
MKKLTGMISVGALAAGVFALAIGVEPAQAKGGVKVGVLKCNQADGWGLILGSSREMKCIFTHKGESYKYEGKIRKFGADIGYQQHAVVLWSVFAPASDVSPGALEGVYVGATAEAAFAVGLGANVLVGGGDSSIALQPVSLEGLQGANVAGGLAELSLTAVK